MQEPEDQGKAQSQPSSEMARMLMLPFAVQQSRYGLRFAVRAMSSLMSAQSQAHATTAGLSKQHARLTQESANSGPTTLFPKRNSVS